MGKESTYQSMFCCIYESYDWRPDRYIVIVVPTVHEFSIMAHQLESCICLVKPIFPKITQELGENSHAY